MQKGKLLALVMALVLMLAAAATAGAAIDYQVITPQNYSANVKYPVVYVMPSDGSGYDDSAVVSTLKSAMRSEQGMNMIIVKPQISEGVDLASQLAEVIAEVDAKYSTIADAKHRAVIGTEVGGYLAYAAAMLDSDAKILSKPELFGLVASIDGNFADNDWVKTYGNLIKKLDSIPDGPDTEEPNDYGITPPENNSAEVAAFLNSFYTYMDTPVDSAWANDDGSTNELGSLCIDAGLADTVHEYTARPGAMTANFMNESVKRVMNRFSKYMLSGVATASVKLDKPSLPAGASAATGSYTVKVSKNLSAHAASRSMTVTVKLVDPKTGKTLDSAVKTHSVSGGDTVSGAFSLKNVVNDVYSEVQLSVKLLNTEVASGTANLIRTSDPVISGDKHVVSLMGDWHFNYVDSYMMGAIKPAMTGAELMASDYKNWSIAQPGFNNWHDGYGNIANPMPGYISNDIFNLMITGSGYYAKTFTLPSNFTKEDVILSIGKIDDRCEVYVNEHFVGATGMKDHETTGETTWAVYSYFDVDPSYLNYGGENVIFVRAWNDTSGGAGGWYQGPIGLYSKPAFEAMNASSSSARFYEETYYSKALGAEKEYLIYLPEGYNQSDRYYPTIYLLHQFNSDHTSYRVDAVDQLFDEGVRAGLFDKAIVVIPNSSEMSFWMNGFMGMPGNYEDMVTKDLIPHIEKNYRCIPDPRYRLTAGCSMGGQGAMSVALTNPNLFSGAVSFFGAFSYGGKLDPNSIVKNVSDDYLKHFSLYFNCGNQDYYDFGVPAISLNKALQERGIEHKFFIENGGHDGAFYLPKFKDAFQYIRKAMYKMPEAEINDLLSASYAVDPDTGDLLVAVEATDKIMKYFLTVPASPYTDDTDPGVTLPVIVTAKYKGGEITETYTVTFDSATLRAVKRLPLPEGAKVTGVTVKTQLLGGDNTGKDGVYTLMGGEDPNLPATGDTSNLALMCALLAASLGGLYITRRKAVC